LVVVSDEARPEHKIHSARIARRFISGLAATRSTEAVTSNFLGGEPCPILLSTQNIETAAAQLVASNIQCFWPVIGRFDGN